MHIFIYIYAHCTYTFIQTDTHYILADHTAHYLRIYLNLNVTVAVLILLFVYRSTFFSCIFFVPCPFRFLVSLWLLSRSVLDIIWIFISPLYLSVFSVNLRLSFSQHFYGHVSLFVIALVGIPLACLCK